MTAEEFSDLFDTLASSYNMQMPFGYGYENRAFNEYEKSYYLTKAQEETVRALYNGKNAAGDSFESTEEQRRYLSNLVEEANCAPESNSNGLILGIGTNTKFFTLPSDCWFITYENVTVDGLNCDSMNPMDVYPVTQDDYNRTKRNPFRGANKRRALRLDLADGVIEIVCKYPVTKYYVRYLRKPKPIVLQDMPDNLTIEGVGTKSDFGESHQACELHEALHHDILERAVLEALQNVARNAPAASTDTNNRKQDNA